MRTQAFMRSPVLLALLSCGITLASGCDDQIRGRTVSPAQLRADEAARAGTVQSGYLHDWRGNSESVPRGLQRTLLVDEFKVDRWDESELCFAVTMRTEAAIDQPLSAWDFKVKIRNTESPAQAEESGQPITQSFENVDFRDSVFKADGFAPGVNAALNITKDSKGTYVVNERHGRVCAAVEREPKYNRMVMLEAKLKDPQGRNLYNRYFWTFLGHH